MTRTSLLKDATPQKGVTESYKKSDGKAVSKNSQRHDEENFHHERYLYGEINNQINILEEEKEYSDKCDQLNIYSDKYDQIVIENSFGGQHQRSQSSTYEKNHENNQPKLLEEPQNDYHSRVLSSSHNRRFSNNVGMLHQVAEVEEY